ncbi:MAG: vWA domain-containing protein [Christensenellales bacterium]|jgi:uncharacterized protein YegL
MAQLDFDAIISNGDTEIRNEIVSVINHAGGTTIDYSSDPHVACCILVDTSSSMQQGSKIQELNDALAAFKNAICEDPLSARRVDVCVISFDNDVNLITPFCPIMKFEAPVLQAGGWTNMAAGIRYALEAVREQMSVYHRIGVECYKPFVLMITDGKPTDDMTGIAELIASRESEGRYGRLRFHAFGVKGADFQQLSSISKRVAAVNHNAFGEIFNWASRSMQVVSHSRPQETPPIPNLPANIIGIDPNGPHKAPWDD